LERLTGLDAGLAARLTARDHALLGLPQQIVELLDGSENDGDYDAIDKALAPPILDQKPPHWLDALRQVLAFRRSGVIDESVVLKAAENVVAYGIRDWGAEPFGGAAHVWRPGWTAVDSDPLFAFSLRQRGDADHRANVHICGEAYSGHQGFIEGALRTAERAVASIVEKYNLPVPELKLSSAENDEAARWKADRAEALNANWAQRNRDIGDVGAVPSAEAS
jgi:hypothetical protein